MTTTEDPLGPDLTRDEARTAYLKLLESFPADSIRIHEDIKIKFVVTTDDGARHEIVYSSPTSASPEICSYGFETTSVLSEDGSPVFRIVKSHPMARKLNDIVGWKRKRGA